MKKYLIICLFSLIFLISGIIFYQYVSNNIIGKVEGNTQIIKNLIPKTFKDFLKKTLFKTKYSSIEKNNELKLIKKFHENNVILYEGKLRLTETVKISNLHDKKYFLKKFSFPQLSTYGMGMKPPGYLGIHNDKLIIVTGKGDFMHLSLSDLNKEQISFNFFENNFDKLIDKKKYIMPGLNAPRDIEIIGDELFVSYHDKYSCDKLSIAKAKINYNFLNFEKFFSWKGCVNKKFNLKNNDTLLDQQSGGRIRDLDENNIIFTIGSFDEYSEKESLSQDMNSLFGSIIMINKQNQTYKILSKGHRNQQGLYYDKDNDIILSSEHGPMGGDELNVIKTNLQDIQNFGWPISSYGNHYPSSHHDWENIDKKDLLYELAPLNKSHVDYGFIEPIKYWTPSIAISEVIKIPNKFDKAFENDFFVASMGNVVAEGDHTIHHLRFDKNFKKITFNDEIIINERIRDLVYDKNNNAVVLILGNTPSLAVLKNNLN